jgi:hypothetical protein
LVSVVVVFATSGLAVAHADTAGRVNATVAAEAAGNRSIAIRNAERRLRSIRLPPGAVVSRDRPSGIGKLLRGPPFILGGTRHVIRHRFWTVPTRPTRIRSWLRGHLPPGASNSGERTGGHFVREFEWSSGPPGTLGALVSMRAVHRAGGGSAVRADIFEGWEYPRPPGARIPARARYLSLELFPGAGGLHSLHEEPRPVRYAATGNTRFVASLVRLVDHQPAYQNVDLPSCGPQVDASQYHLIVLDFKPRPLGPVLARVSEETPIGICTSLDLRLANGKRYSLEASNELPRLLHSLIRRARPSLSDRLLSLLPF